MKQLKKVYFPQVSSVQTLFLNNNDIDISERERPRMFSNFDSLVNLHLTNAFTENTTSSYYLLSLEDIFYMSDLSLVVKLHLEQNEIYTIGKNARIFCELKALQQLYLGDNKLSDLDFRLDCMPDLTYVDLQRNMIKRLSEDAMRRIDQKLNYSLKPITVDFLQNPFACDCLSKSFINWLQSTNVTVRDLQIYRCNDGIPKTNIGKMLTEVDTDHLHCSDEHFHHVSPPAAEDYSSKATNMPPTKPEDLTARINSSQINSETKEILKLFLAMFTSLQLEHDLKIKTLEKKITEIQSKNVNLKKDLDYYKEAIEHDVSILKEEASSLKT